MSVKTQLIKNYPEPTYEQYVEYDDRLKNYTRVLGEITKTTLKANRNESAGVYGSLDLKLQDSGGVGYTVWGVEAFAAILHITDSEYWEQVKGKPIYALFDKTDGRTWGNVIRGVSNADPLCKGTGMVWYDEVLGD